MLYCPLKLKSVKIRRTTINSRPKTWLLRYREPTTPCVQRIRRVDDGLTSGSPAFVHNVEVVPHLRRLLLADLALVG